MLFPLWLENIVVAAQQWLPAALLGGFALILWRRWPDGRDEARLAFISVKCCRTVTFSGP